MHRVADARAPKLCNELPDAFSNDMSFLVIPPNGALTSVSGKPSRSIHATASSLVFPNCSFAATTTKLSAMVCCTAYATVRLDLQRPFPGVVSMDFPLKKIVFPSLHRPLFTKVRHRSDLPTAVR